MDAAVVASAALNVTQKATPPRASPDLIAFENHPVIAFHSAK
jgi:hypothetical protein